MPGKSSRSAAVGAAMLAKAASVGTAEALTRRPAQPTPSRRQSAIITGHNPVHAGTPQELHARQAVRQSLKLSADNTIFANVGRNHADYGLTPAEHAASKASRRARGPVFRGMQKVVDLGAVRGAPVTVVDN